MAISVERITPGNPVVVKGLEGASTQTFDAGDLVKFSAGYVVTATDGVIHGIARRDATGTQSTEIEVELIDKNAVYSAKVGSGETHAQTMVGTIMDFTFTVAGEHYLSSSGGTDTLVVALDPRDAVGATQGRVYFKFQDTLQE
jgi:hypothetical protein